MLNLLNFAFRTIGLHLFLIDNAINSSPLAEGFFPLFPPDRNDSLVALVLVGLAVLLDAVDVVKFEHDRVESNKVCTNLLAIGGVVNTCGYIYLCTLIKGELEWLFSNTEETSLSLGRKDMIFIGKDVFGERIRLSESEIKEQRVNHSHFWLVVLLCLVFEMERVVCGRHRFFGLCLL